MGWVDILLGGSLSVTRTCYLGTWGDPAAGSIVLQQLVSLLPAQRLLQAGASQGPRTGLLGAH